MRLFVNCISRRLRSLMFLICSLFLLLFFQSSNAESSRSTAFKTSFQIVQQNRTVLKGTSSEKTQHLLSQLQDLKNQLEQLKQSVKVQSKRSKLLESKLQYKQESYKNNLSQVNSRIVALEKRNQRWEQFVLLQEKQRLLLIKGVNVQIVNGSGETDSNNGVGNLIVGYNEILPSKKLKTIRVGSHNLVVGEGHSYASHGGVVFGRNNKVTAPFAAVLGGEKNQATAHTSSVLGGYQNVTTGEDSTVSGGTDNKAVGEGATVAGGSNNLATGADATVTGGHRNQADFEDSSVTGGTKNMAQGDYASVCGGEENDAFSDKTTICGGHKNLASGVWSTILGGAGNHASGSASSVLGGQGNEARGSWASVSGGHHNKATSRWSSVSGGERNMASGDWSFVSGGFWNKASGSNATIVGGRSNISAEPYSIEVGGVGSNTHFEVKSTKKKASKVAPTKKPKKQSVNNAKARQKSILRGLDWIDRYIDKHWLRLKHNALCALAELMSTSDPLIRQRVLKISNRLVPKLMKYFLSDVGIEDRGELFDAIEFVSYAKILQFEPGPLLVKVHKWLKKYPTAEKLYGHQLKDLSKLNDDQVYALVMNTHLLERAAATYNDSRFLRKEFTMFHIMKYIRQWKYVDFDKDKDPDKVRSDMDGYLATHVAYAFTNYGHLYLKKSDIPLVEPYMRRNFRAVMKMQDVELISEFIDVWRSMGLNDANDSMVKQGTDFLLKVQKKDGSWGPWEKDYLPYDAFHYTWCVVLGLRDRVFKKNTRFDLRRRSILRRLNRLDAQRAKSSATKPSQR